MSYNDRGPPGPYTHQPNGYQEYHNASTAQPQYANSASTAYSSQQSYPVVNCPPISAEDSSDSILSKLDLMRMIQFVRHEDGFTVENDAAKRWIGILHQRGAITRRIYGWMPTALFLQSQPPQAPPPQSLPQHRPKPSRQHHRNVASELMKEAVLMGDVGDLADRFINVNAFSQLSRYMKDAARFLLDGESLVAPPYPQQFRETMSAPFVGRELRRRLNCLKNLAFELDSLGVGDDSNDCCRLLNLVRDYLTDYFQCVHFLETDNIGEGIAWGNRFEQRRSEMRLSRQRDGSSHGDGNDHQQNSPTVSYGVGRRSASSHDGGRRSDGRRRDSENRDYRERSESRRHDRSGGTDRGYRHDRRQYDRDRGNDRDFRSGSRAFRLGQSPGMDDRYRRSVSRQNHDERRSHKQSYRLRFDRSQQQGSMAHPPRSHRANSVRMVLREDQKHVPRIRASLGEINNPKSLQPVSLRALDGPPFDGRRRVLSAEQAAIQLSNYMVVEDDGTRRFKPELVCGQCGHTSHTLHDCNYPDDDGYCMGCPLCNTKLHNWDECKLKAEISPYARCSLVLRGPRAPIRSTTPWVHCLKEALNNGWENLYLGRRLPWTIAFAASQHKGLDSPWLSEWPGQKCASDLKTDIEFKDANEVWVWLENNYDWLEKEVHRSIKETKESK